MIWFGQSIASELRRLSFRMRQPKAVRFSLIRRARLSMGLVYAVTAGPAVDPDVVSRRLSVTVGGETTTTSFSADSTSFGEVTVPQDAAVVLTLVDVDDAGNVSQPAVVEFVATDTIAPAQPGELGVSLVREE